MRRSLIAPGLLGLCLSVSTPAFAASLFVQVPGITGEQSTPGYPGAMAVQSLEIRPNQFTIQKNVDSASPAIVNAVAQGTLFPSATALVYNGSASGPPDASLPFSSVIATSSQQGGGTTEQDTFATTIPASIFLELPGISGEQSTPGHSGVMQISSLVLTPNQFSIVKPLDSASPSILSAVANGTLFASASVLFYNAANPAGPPDNVLTFGNVIATSSQKIFDQPLEVDTFAFVTVPEPSSVALLLLGGLTAIGRMIVSFRRSYAATARTASDALAYNSK